MLVSPNRTAPRRMLGSTRCHISVFRKEHHKPARHHQPEADQAAAAQRVGEQRDADQRRGQRRESAITASVPTPPPSSARG